MIDRTELQRWTIAAAEGEGTAIEPLFHALWPVLVAYATRFVGDRALAEDCAQDALVKLFAQLDRFDRERDALTWALAITTWECRTARKRGSRRGEQPLDEAPAGASTLQGAALDGAAIAEQRELVRAAVAVLESLAPRDRDIIAAALADDGELRRALTPATFRKRLERAYARLRTSWRSRHGTL